MSQDTIRVEAVKITSAAEHAHTAEATEAINKQLLTDRQTLSPSDYNKLLTEITADNRADVAKNAALPTIFFTESKPFTSYDGLGVAYPSAQQVRDENAFRKIKADAGHDTPQSCKAVGTDLDKFQKEMTAGEYQDLYNRVVRTGVTSHCEHPLKAPYGGWNVV